LFAFLLGRLEVWSYLTLFDSCSVSSEAAWLQAFGCLANYPKAASVFRDGELRVVGLNFI
jgi:hypothetical protein